MPQRRRQSRRLHATSVTDKVDNVAIAELCAREADRAQGHLRRAFRRASRAALIWPVEAGDLLSVGRSVAELDGIGPYLARIILNWIEKPPEIPAAPPIRHDFLTLTQAKGVLALHPDWNSMLRGDLHLHTVWSDGSGTTMEMAEAAAEQGYAYFAITDHTKGLKIANGLNEERLKSQGDEINSINRALAEKGIELTVLRSAEVNLSPYGQPDLSTNSLRQLDLVLGSFHSALRRTDDQTERYLAALRSPYIHVISHPQTRIFNHREGLIADWNRVFAEAARLDKAVEIDGYPDRQDLKRSLVRIARHEGARISLGTDAHHPWQLGFITFSLAAACLCKIPKNRILNFMSAEQIRTWARQIIPSS